MRRRYTTESVGLSTIVIVALIVIIVTLSTLGAYLVLYYKPASSSFQGRYALTFNQRPLCTSPSTSLYDDIFIPWSVTLSHGLSSSTKVEPANSSTVPSSSDIINVPYNSTNRQFATITFYVTNGQYNYVFGPANQFYVNQTGISSGIVEINGNNASIDVYFQLSSCGSVTTSTTSITTSNSSQPTTPSFLFNDTSAKLFLESLDTPLGLLTTTNSSKQIFLADDQALDYAALSELGNVSLADNISASMNPYGGLYEYWNAVFVLLGQYPMSWNFFHFQITP